MPDFICEGQRPFLVEVKASAGKTLKLKHETMAGLEEWTKELTVWFFFVKRDAVSFTNYATVAELCASARTYRFENDHKPYYSVSTSKLEWEPFQEVHIGEENERRNEHRGY
jgi:hypothetical protein